MRAVTSDERLNSFLDEQYRRLGVLRVLYSDSSAEVLLRRQGLSYEKAAFTIGNWGHQGEVEVFEYDSPSDNARRWVAQWVEGDGDDVGFAMTAWSRKPHSRDILDYLIARKIEIDVDLERLSPTFDCWECGRECHVLNCVEVQTPGRVLEVMQECQCGC